MTPKNIDEILTEFEDKFDHDDPNGRAVVFLESDEGSTRTFPAQHELKDFLRTALKSYGAYILEQATQCSFCCGKGCSSVLTQERGFSDFGGEGYVDPPKITNKPCGKCKGTGLNDLTLADVREKITKLTIKKGHDGSEFAVLKDVYEQQAVLDQHCLNKQRAKLN